MTNEKLPGANWGGSRTGAGRKAQFNDEEMVFVAIATAGSIAIKTAGTGKRIYGKRQETFEEVRDIFEKRYGRRISLNAIAKICRRFKKYRFVANAELDARQFIGMTHDFGKAINPQPKS